MQLPLNEVFRTAFAHEARGETAQARALYEAVLAAIPEHPGALLKIAGQHRRAGGDAEARGCLERALVSAQAMRLPVEEIRLALADLALADGDVTAAEIHCREAMAAGADSAATWLDLALSLSRQGRLDEADAAADAGLARQPEAPEAFQIAATIAYQRNDPGRAAGLCRQGLAAAPRHPGLLHLLGLALKAAGASAGAREALQAVLTAGPGNAGVRVSLGAACLDLRLAAEAREHLEFAVANGAGSAEAYDNLGIAYRQLGETARALAAFERAVAIDPELTPALANRVMALRTSCAWDSAEAAARGLLAWLAEPGADPRLSPLVVLAIPATPVQQLAIARGWSARMLPRVARPPPAPAPAPAMIGSRGSRLRVGYLSSDFHDHATARLAVGVFEHHDRRRVEAFAYSAGPDDGSAMRARLRAAFEHWREVRTLPDAAAADLIRDDRLDVLVEMKGHTEGARLGILAHRPGPVQIHYLGFPGTLGFDAIDAVVGDRVVVPPGEESSFHERVLRLPRCYQPNDRRRPLPPPPAREAVGLRDDALVLACFNQTYKLSREFFTAWMAALARRPTAQLWLYAPDPVARGNLIAEAARCAIAAERIVFADTVAQPEHLARLQLADLALDVLPYGAHTTGSDALWAGVPMLTCRGPTFAGRVGASLLEAAGLAAMITESLGQYRSLLCELVDDPERLRAPRRHLEAQRMRLPLFDVEAYTRDWEGLLEALPGSRGD